MLKKDGNHVFYKLQHSFDGKTWMYSSFDQFGSRALVEALPEYNGKLGPTANGDCWQQLGEHGSFHYGVMLKIALWLANNFGVSPDRTIKYSFRVVEVQTIQTTTPVGTELVSIGYRPRRM